MFQTTNQSSISQTNYMNRVMDIMIHLGIAMDKIPSKITDSYGQKPTCTLFHCLFLTILSEFAYLLSNMRSFPG